MTTNELKQYIDKTLGNSIRCLLPSYWWRRLLSLVVDKVDEVETTATNAKNRANAVANNMNNLEYELRGEIRKKTSSYTVYDGTLYGWKKEEQMESVAAIRKELNTTPTDFQVTISSGSAVYKPLRVALVEGDSKSISIRYVVGNDLVTLVTDGESNTESREPIEGAISMLYYPSDDILTADEIAHNKAILAAMRNKELDAKDIIVGQKRIVLGNTTYQSVSVDKITYIGLLDTSGLAIYCTLYDDLITPSTYMSRIEFRSDGEIATSVWDIDTEMSDTSVKAVQNKVIKAYVDTQIAQSITTTLNTAV